jgi:hypothetical protein
VRRGLTFVAALLLGGCYHQAKDLLGGAPDSGLVLRKRDAAGLTAYAVPANPIVPNADLRLTPNLGLSLENALIGAAIYVFVDPLSPNWEGELRRLSEDTFGIALRSKRWRSSGGDGEAARLFRRHAERIAREGGFAGYDILSYSEGIESETLGAVRYAEGTIRLSRK